MSREITLGKGLIYHDSKGIHSTRSLAETFLKTLIVKIQTIPESLLIFPNCCLASTIMTIVCKGYFWNDLNALALRYSL